LIQRFIIRTPLPALNEILSACNHRGYDGSSLKLGYQKAVVKELKRLKLKPVDSAVFSFVWRCPNKRKDKDNIASGGRKIIFDALVEIGVIENDGWKQVEYWRDFFRVHDKRTQEVAVTIYSKEKSDV